MKEKPDNPLYNDVVFRVIACLLAAHVIVMMGRPDLTTFEAFDEPAYYPTIAINFCIALIVGWTVKKVTLALDKRHPWYKDIWRRAMMQFAFGVLGVSILSYLLVLIYFVSFGESIVESGYLHYELPFSAALISILNFYYVSSYFYMHPRQTEPVEIPIELLQESDLTENTEEVPLPAASNGTYDTMKQVQVEDLPPFTVITPEPMGVNGNKKGAKEMLIIDTPKRSIPIRVANVLMFFIVERTVFIWKKGMNSLNDCYQTPLHLNEVMELLDEQDFYRINRQCIVSIQAIESYQPLGHKTLSLAIRKEYGILANMEEKKWKSITTVAEDRAEEFKRWINR